MKILFLIGTGIAAPYVTQSWARAAKALGHSPEFLPLFKGQDVFSEIQKAQPDLCVALDHSGLPHKELSEAGLYHCSWFVDHPLYFMRPEDFNPFHLAAVIDRSFLKPLEKLGSMYSFYCPLAYDADLFSHSDDEPVKQDIDVSFVGTFPGVYENLVAARKARTDLFFNTILDTAFHLKQKHPEWTLLETLEYVEIKGGIPFLQKTTAQQLSWVLRSLDSELESLVKSEFVRKISGFNLCVYGNELWSTLPSMNAVFRGPIQYGKDLAVLYRQSKINVVLTRSQLTEGVNQRVFDIPASGGFFLCDYRLDLEKLFPNLWQKVTFRNLDELREKTEYYLHHNEERLEIAALLHDCIAQKHSYLLRMGEFLNHVTRHTGIS